ncbi:hypothetical protein [Sediminibacterium sp.]|uniref:hypothetical protein n=1 Tax=Sediminibacterium sp. TaxID=1917865 RepID=UPI003F6F86A5
MTQITTKSIHLILLYIFFVTNNSCTSAKIPLSIPQNSTSKKVNTINVSGIKGKKLPGSKSQLRFDSKFSGTFTDGWSVSKGTYDKTTGGIFTAEEIKRTLLLNLGLDINDVTARSTNKFQFYITNLTDSIFIFCKQEKTDHSKNFKYNKTKDFSIPKSEESNFSAILLTSSNTNKIEWKLNLNYKIEITPGSFSTLLREGTTKESGLLTNNTDTILIKPLVINLSNQKSESNSITTPFKIVGGYEFIMQEKTIGIVDLYHSSFSFFSDTNANYELIIAATSTALLLRNR